MAQGNAEIIRLLEASHDGSDEARQELTGQLYQELRVLASHYMRLERRHHSLQTTALVHEAYIRLVGSGTGIEWRTKAQFLALAAQVMRRILVDHARGRSSLKRGGNAPRVDLDDALVVAEERSREVLAVDDALTRLGQWDERQSHIVELRFFGGLQEKEIAEALGISVRTVRRDWKLARAWLRSELYPGGSDDT